jgi:hypothetical protein
VKESEHTASYTTKNSEQVKRENAAIEYQVVRLDTAAPSGCISNADCNSGQMCIASTCIKVPEQPVSVLEFPSILLSITDLIGFLGSVLFIRRTREH